MNAKFSIKITCLVVFFLWTWLLLNKYCSLGYYDWDFAFFAQAMWSLSHGSTYVSLFGINFFSNHANLIAVILVPLFKIFPSPFTLLTLKLISFFVASYVLYLLAEEKLGSRIALIILFLFWIDPFNIYGLIYEFDFENLSPAFILLAYYFYKKNNWLSFIISSIFLIMIKENMPLIILAFGIHSLCTKSDKISWGLVPIVLGALSFFILAFIFVPLMGGHDLGHHPYGSHYSNLNLDLFLHPIQAWPHLMTYGKIKWLIYLFGPMSLSLLSPGTLFLGLPIIVQHLFSNVRQEHALDYSYSLTITPFIFLAFINALDWINERSVKRTIYLVLFIFLAFNIIFLLSQMHHIRTRYMPTDLTPNSAFGWKLLKEVPPDAAVVASFRFLPELSQRAHLYSFHKIYDPDYQNKDCSYKIPPDVHYALVDFKDPWLRDTLDDQGAATRARINNFIAQGAWQVKYKATGIVLFER